MSTWDIAPVIEAVVAMARARSGSAVAVTFDPHPRAVIHPDDPPVVLTSMEEKRRRLQDAGIDILAVVPFTREVQMLSPEAFVSTYLVTYLDAKVVVLGYDHGFGKGRSGDPDTMRALGHRFGFDVAIVPPTMAGEGPVSSSRLRDLIREGRIDEAREMLGGGYPVSGRVAPRRRPRAGAGLSDREYRARRYHETVAAERCLRGEGVCA